jgi:hypothetical protein
LAYIGPASQYLLVGLRSPTLTRSYRWKKGQPLTAFLKLMEFNAEAIFGLAMKSGKRATAVQDAHALAMSSGFRKCFGLRCSLRRGTRLSRDTAFVRAEGFSIFDKFSYGRKRRGWQRHWPKLPAAVHDVNVYAKISYIYEC